MQRLFWSAALCLILTAPARAHFPWLLPPENPKDPVRLVFSDTLKPDDPTLLKKLAATELFIVGADGKAMPVKATEGQDALLIAVPEGDLRVLAGVCRYGVVQRGEMPPFLLTYHPKTFVGPLHHPAPFLFKGNDRLTLEILPVEKKPAVCVLWQGKPLAGATISVLAPGEDKAIEGKTDADGQFELGETKGAGLYGLRVLYTEKKAGEVDGKKYQEARHYATLTIRVPGEASPQEATLEKLKQQLADLEAVLPKPDAPPVRKADPAATRLLAEARAARANWDNFPGFTADLEVNFDGKIFKAPLTVTAKGDVQVTFTGSDEEVGRWARRQLGSLVGHRTGNSVDGETPCAFADDVVNHPLGRAILVLNDEFHSSYRIRDRQVIVVNRQTPDSRFTITVLENHLNAEKHFLPGTYVVNTWDLKTDVLKRSDTYHHTWQRFGAFDLPTELLVVSATDGKQEARSLKLTGHKVSTANR
jgi:hypothetical protein